MGNRAIATSGSKTRSTRNDTLPFPESNSRFIVEIRPENQKQFESLVKEEIEGVINPNYISYSNSMENGRIKKYTVLKLIL